MAPDINSLSPPSVSTPELVNTQPLNSSNNPSRRTSQIMGPPPVPASAALAGYHHRPSNPTTFDTSAGVPLRHPRPLTAAELYLECEKEQEAVVNRLTRELTALRAQCASVASNASQSSSASLLPVDISDPNPTHQLTGATHPTPSRRHRSSSSLSARSIPTATTMQSQPNNNSNMPAGAVSQASAERAAAVVGASRQPSASASGTSTPARRSMDVLRPAPFPGTLYTLPHRPSISRDHSYNSQAAASTAAQAGTPVPQQSTSPLPSPNHTMLSVGQHLADNASSEVDILKAENEALRQRVRTLERAMRNNGRDSSQSDAIRAPELSYRPSREQIPPVDFPRNSISGSSGLAAWAAGDGGVGGVAGRRERSESQSTTASSRRAVGVVDDELRVGESAGSAGIARFP